MKCMCAQTRPRFILSSERVFGGMEFEPMLPPREKSPLPKNFPRGGSNPRRCCQRAQTLPTSYSGPHSLVSTPKTDVRLLFVGCLTSQQHASVSQGRICSDNFTCCHTETEVPDQTFHLTQSQYTDNGPTSPSTDLITPGAWQGSHWSANLFVSDMTRPRKKNPVASGIRTRDLPLSRRTP